MPRKFTRRSVVAYNVSDDFIDPFISRAEILEVEAKMRLDLDKIFGGHRGSVDGRETIERKPKKTIGVKPRKAVGSKPSEPSEPKPRKMIDLKKRK